MIVIYKKIILREYVAVDGRNHFRSYLAMLPTVERARVQARLFRAESGNLGDCKSLGAGLFELKMTFFGGIRVYFGIGQQDMKKISMLILLCAGNKRVQSRDVLKARTLWKEYLSLTKDR